MAYIGHHDLDDFKLSVDENGKIDNLDTFANKFLKRSKENMAMLNIQEMQNFACNVETQLKNWTLFKEILEIIKVC